MKPEARSRGIQGIVSAETVDFKFVGAFYFREIKLVQMGVLFAAFVFGLTGSSTGGGTFASNFCKIFVHTSLFE